MLLAFIVAASLSALQPQLTFTRSPSFSKYSVRVEVGTLAVGAQRSSFWFKRVIRRVDGAEEVWWTDTVRCPKAREVLRTATQLERPRIGVIGLEDNWLTVTGDGVGYTLKAEAGYPNRSLYDIEFRSNSNTPLARWVDESLDRLEPCWSRRLPEFPRQQGE